MKKLKLYLETSVFGFYFDTAVPNQQKRIAVRKRLRQIKKGVFEGQVEVQPLLQSRIQEFGSEYLVRVFVNIDRKPAEVVTTYRTSKVLKYWRAEV